MFAQAVSVLQPLADSPQADYEVLVFYAQLLLKAHRAEAADAPLASALALDPERIGARLAQVRQRIQLGRIKDAVTSALEVLDRDPASTPAAAMLSEIAPEHMPESTISALEALLDDVRVDAETCGAAGLALGRVMETRGSHERAFDAFAMGNRALKRRAAMRGYDYDPAVVEARVEGLQKSFPGMINFDGSDGEGLVFIVGMPRSGTTLLDRILAAHRQVVSVGEHAMMPAIAERAGADSGDPSQFEADMSASAGSWRSQYLSSLPHRPTADRVIVDKLPLNFWNIGLIVRLFPRATIVHACRDPRDVGLSSFRLRFPESFRYVNDFNDFAHYYAQYCRLMSHWRRVLSGRLLRIDYEQVVDSIEPCVRRLLDACDLSWDPACLKFSENRDAVYTLSMGQVRRELYREATQRWKRYGDRMAPLVHALESQGVVLPPT
ncbi:MAG: sulfotransferase [Wenzhouxiangellaceae bacterium]